ncbi:MAG: FtsW/RodA/SpoVE family cell cycle protein [Muribaculaceae bacterium]|nr:FtsW/RodA/SpoVE family cell cycle protein [Muribaculaceae bacterium]
MTETNQNTNTAVSSTFETAAPAAVNNGDKHIWGIYLALCFISLVELYSASSREVAASSFGVLGPIIRHVGMLIGGFVIMWVISRRHYREVIPMTILLAAVSSAMMLYVMKYGEIVNGARRSFSVLGIPFQPAEFIKLSSVLIVALLMSRTQKRKSIGVRDSGVVWSAVFIGLFCAMLLPQGLTNTLLLMSISLGMMVIGGTPWKRIILVVGIYAIFAGAFTAFKMKPGNDDADVDRTGTWKARIERFFDPTPKYEQPFTAENRQEMYAYMAQAHGGVVGVMPGNSRETSRLPLAFSDFIYSIIIEDLGLVGGIAVLIIYLWLLGRASSIATKCSRAYPALLVIGMAVMIVMQALFHMAIVTGVVPVSGQPLPLISKGGTSILVTSIAFGIMLSVSRFAVRTGSKKQIIREEINALPEELSSENPTQL